MANRKRSGRVDGKRNPGVYFYQGDWLKSEVMGCSDAAYRLWHVIWCRMMEEEPWGVFPGDKRRFCVRFGLDPSFADAAWGKYEPLLQELHESNVFSWGEEIDEGLDPDAIVNRRLYREWCHKEGVSEARSYANSQRKVCREKRERDGFGVYKNEQNQQNSTNEQQTAGLEVLEKQGVSGGFAGGESTKMNLSRSDPNDPIICSPNLGTESGLVPVVRDLEPKGLWGRIVRVTGDRVGGPWAKWWNRVVNAYNREGLLHLLDEKVKYVEDCMNPVVAASKGIDGVNAPGPFLSSRVLAQVRELRKQGISLDIPANPSRAA